MDRVPSRQPMLASPLTRAAIVTVLLLLIAGAFIYVRSRGERDDAGGATLFGAPSPSASTTPESGLGPLDGRHPIVGEPAPDFALRDLDGQVVKLSDLRGKVVWVNFWATWCRPCKKELPAIQKLADEHALDLVVLAVDWQDSANAVRSYLDGEGLSLRALLDRGGVYGQYGLKGLPDSFFVDRDGNLAAFQWGPLTESKMRERLAQAGIE